MIAGMEQAEVQQDAELRAWDWRRELIRQERSIPWLARQTHRQQNTVYRYAWGTLRPSIDWLRAAAQALGKGTE